MTIGTKVVATRLVPEGGIIAITLFGIVFTRHRERVDSHVLNHELIHCQQQLECLYVPFFVLYLLEWLWHWFRLRDRERAYLAISFEREAYRYGHNLEYLKKRRHFANFRMRRSA